jgi:hypothetical protein
MTVAAPTYQISVFTHQEGWRFWPTKHVIRWTFGFSKASALAYGLRGRHCRGEEYVVVLNWSRDLRQVWVNNMLIHESSATTIRGNRGFFEYCFDMPTKFDNLSHIVQIKAEGGRKLQAELFVDGEAFSEMMEVYELGARCSKTIQFPRNNQLSFSSRMEEEMIAIAKAQSLKEMKSSWHSTLPRLPLPVILVSICVLVLRAEESGYLMSLAYWIRFAVQCTLLYCAIAVFQDRWPGWLKKRFGEAMADE